MHLLAPPCFSLSGKVDLVGSRMDVMLVIALV